MYKRPKSTRHPSSSSLHFCFYFHLKTVTFGTQAGHLITKQGFKLKWIAFTGQPLVSCVILRRMALPQVLVLSDGYCNLCFSLLSHSCCQQQKETSLLQSACIANQWKNIWFYHKIPLRWLGERIFPKLFPRWLIWDDLIGAPSPYNSCRSHKCQQLMAPHYLPENAFFPGGHRV